MKERYMIILYGDVELEWTRYEGRRMKAKKRSWCNSPIFFLMIRDIFPVV